MDQTQRLRAYLARLGLAEAPRPTPGGLATLQMAHRQTIGFENLDILLGRPIRIDSEAVFDKLVLAGRGGYCFEQNRLFADMLSALGLAVRPLLARVRLGLSEGIVPPRTHVLLLVELEGVAWIADAGFGGSYVPPLQLVDGACGSSPDGARHRLLKVGTAGALGGEWRLERAGPPGATDGRVAPHGDWQAQYTFDLAEVAPEDLELSNHWTSTRPATRFTTLHVASVVLADGFAAMTGRALSIHAGGKSETRSITDAADYARTLRDTFRIALSGEDAARLPLFAG